MKKKLATIAVTAAIIGGTLAIIPAVTPTAPTTPASALVYAYAPGWGPYTTLYRIEPLIARKVTCSTSWTPGKYLFSEYQVRTYTVAPWIGQKYQVGRKVVCK